MRILNSKKFLNHTIIITTEADLFNCEEHSHSFIELAYTVDGKAIHILNGQEQIISGGDYVIINPGDIHNYKKIGKEKLSIINCIFTPSSKKDMEQTYTFEDLLNTLNIERQKLICDPTKHVFHDDKDKTVLNLLQIMKNEYQTQNMKYKVFMNYLYEIIILSSIRSIHSRPKDAFNIIDYIKDYVEEHYNESGLLQTISDNTQYTIQYLSTKFKKETGRTFKEFLQFTRMNKAATLLLNTNMQVPQVAEAVGYSDIKYFINTFKKYKEYTPMKFRNLKIPKS